VYQRDNEISARIEPSWVFKTFKMGESDRPKKTEILRLVVSTMSQYVLKTTRWMMAPENVKLGNDDRRDLSEVHRQLFLLFAVEEAVFLYQNFWDSRSKDDIAVKTTKALVSDMGEWASGHAAAAPGTLAQIMDALCVLQWRFFEKIDLVVFYDLLEQKFLEDKIASGELPESALNMFEGENQ